MMKKILCILLMMVLAAPCLTLGAAASDSSQDTAPVVLQVDASNIAASAKVSDVSGKIGDEVKVDIVMRDNPGIAAFRFYLDFDNTALEPISIAKGSAVTAGNIYSNVSGDDISVLVTTWDNAYDVAMNGVIFTVTFRIKQTSGLGNYPLVLSYNQVDICNENFEDVYFQVINGGIDVNGFNIYCDDSPNISIGQSIQVFVDMDEANPIKNELVWSSDNAQVAVVDKNGIVTGIGAGNVVISASTQDGKYKEYYNIRVYGVEPTAQSASVIDYENSIIYGISAGLKTLDNYITVTDTDCYVEYETLYDSIGTGSIVNVLKNGEVVDCYTVVVFGDIQGDGWYDADDAFIVNMIVCGLLDESKLSDVMQKAADCNHDSVINEIDVELLMGAGVRRNDIDQNAAYEELVTQVAYIEYVSLVDQSASMSSDMIFVPDIGAAEQKTTTHETDEPVEYEDNIVSEDETGTEKSKDSVEKTDVEIIIMNIFGFIKNLFALIFSFIIK